MRTKLSTVFQTPRRADSYLINRELDSRAGAKAGEIPGAVLAERLALLQGAIAGTPYDDWMLFTDDSHWEPNVNYTTLAPHVGTFCTRGGGPTNWSEDGSNDSPDPNWFDKAQKIRATGLSLGSYWVVNFGLMTNDFTHPAPIIDAMKTAYYGKFIPDWIALDYEVNYFYRGSNKITIPNANLVKGMSYLLNAVWEEWRKTVVVYSRVTFLEETGTMPDGTNGFKTVFDNNNKADTRFPLWLAYYPSSVYIAKELSPDPSIVKPLLPAKKNTNRRYMEFGLTNPAHIGWQFTSKMTWEGTELDWSLFPMTKNQWNEWIGFTPSTPTPNPDPEPSPDLAALTARVAAMEAKLSAVKSAL